MTSMSSRRSKNPIRAVAPTLLALVVAALSGAALAGCGGSDVDLPPLASEGRDIVRSRGCAACHGRNGAGGVGPSWVGLYGATEELESGESVVVDDAYIRRSIADPSADVVAGYRITMPENTLTDTEIDAVIAYIEVLAG